MAGCCLRRDQDAGTAKPARRLNSTGCSNAHRVGLERRYGSAASLSVSWPSVNSLATSVFLLGWELALRNREFLRKPHQDHDMVEPGPHRLGIGAASRRWGSCRSACICRSCRSALSLAICGCGTRGFWLGHERHFHSWIDLSSPVSSLLCSVQTMCQW